jgi:hypothetical protein
MNRIGSARSTGGRTLPAAFVRFRLYRWTRHTRGTTKGETHEGHVPRAGKGPGLRSARAGTGRAPWTGQRDGPRRPAEGVPLRRAGDRNRSSSRSRGVRRTARPSGCRRLARFHRPRRPCLPPARTRARRGRGLESRDRAHPNRYPRPPARRIARLRRHRHHGRGGPAEAAARAGFRRRPPHAQARGYLGAR